MSPWPGQHLVFVGFFLWGGEKRIADVRNQRKGSGRPVDEISSAKAEAGMWFV